MKLDSGRLSKNVGDVGKLCSKLVVQVVKTTF
jgi:hypothetical protein